MRKSNWIISPNRDENKEKCQTTTHIMYIMIQLILMEIWGRTYGLLNHKSFFSVEHILSLAAFCGPINRKAQTKKAVILVDWVWWSKNYRSKNLANHHRSGASHNDSHTWFSCRWTLIRKFQKKKQPEEHNTSQYCWVRLISIILWKKKILFGTRCALLVTHEVIINPYK